MGKDNNSKIVTKEITMMEPAYPNFRTYVKRLETFQGWPSDKTQTPQDLADAGFFFTNDDDKTFCYHCGGSLKSWEKGDQPWIEHSRWFNSCVYIRTVKGEDFIQRAISGASAVTQTSEDEIDTFEDEIDSSENNTKKMCKVC